MIHLIVGNTGAGKTTYSNKLKQEKRAMMFSIDKWNNTLFMSDKKENDGLEWILERIERVETMIQNQIVELEHIGVDSILDLGFSKVSHREKFLTFSSKHGIQTQIHYLDVAKNIRRERVLSRNQEKGETYEFDVTEDMFNFMESWFEPLTSNEEAEAIIIKK